MVLERLRLTDHIAVVTGAGRGIGAASALALAEAGASVSLAARTPEQLGEVAARARALGVQAITVPCDVTDAAQIEALVERTVAELGGIDVVVNNAGGTNPRPFLDTTPGYLERSFHFNVTSAFLLTKLAVPHLLARGGGSVVNISSAISRLRDRGFVAYGTAKAALSHLTRLAAADLAPRIRVNAIAVGSVATSALETVLDRDELRAEMESRIPLGRLGEPDDIAFAVAYLASPAAAWVTGKVLEVDGGLEEPNLPLGLPDL